MSWDSYDSDLFSDVLVNVVILFAPVWVLVLIAIAAVVLWIW